MLALMSASWISADTLSVKIGESQPNPSTWAYTLSNESSPYFLYGFLLPLAAPIQAIGTPDGWNSQTDGYTYVYWWSTDTVPPYTHDIAPGTSLAGFFVSAPSSLSELSTSTLFTWDNAADQPGPPSYPDVDTPVAVSGEPPALGLLACGLITCLFIYRAGRVFGLDRNQML